MTIVVLAMVSCNHNENNKETEQDRTAAALVGTWNLISIVDTRSVSIGNEEVDVYVVFQADEPAATKAEVQPEAPSTGTFVLYQMLGTGRYRTFRGTWSLTDKLLSGIYAGGTPWGADYEVTLDDDNTRLTLAAGTESCVYTRATLPSGL